jgi:hypothetical protein
MFSPLPLLADFGMVVTVNIAVAVLSALVVVPPLVMEADRRGLLHTGARVPSTESARWRAALGWLAGALLVVTGLGLVIVTVGGSEESAAGPPRRTERVEPPAELPPSTTSPPTTVATTTATSAPADGPAPATTLAAGQPERPAGLVAGAFWDALTGAGVDPGVARCAADDLIATTPEPELLAMGIADSPRPAEVDALLAAAGARCGVTEEQLAAAAGG